MICVRHSHTKRIPGKKADFFRPNDTILTVPSAFIRVWCLKYIQNHTFARHMHTQTCGDADTLFMCVQRVKDKNISIALIHIGLHISFLWRLRTFGYGIFFVALSFSHFFLLFLCFDEKSSDFAAEHTGNFHGKECCYFYDLTKHTQWLMYFFCFFLSSHSLIFVYNTFCRDKQTDYFLLLSSKCLENICKQFFLAHLFITNFSN